MSEGISAIFAPPTVIIPIKMAIRSKYIMKVHQTEQGGNLACVTVFVKDQNKGEGLPQSPLFLSEQDSVCQRTQTSCPLMESYLCPNRNDSQETQTLIHVKPENTPWVPILTYTLPSILIKRPVFPQ